MKYNQCLSIIEKELDIKITHSLISEILNVGATALVNRANRDGNIKEDEIKKLEDYFALSIDREVAIPSIDLYYYPNVFGSCGTGSVVFDETKEKISVAKDMITNYSPNNKYSVISARGSSMSPKIEDSDKLVIQQWNGEQIIDDNVYLFKYNDELFIKRLVKNIDQIVCISENPRFEDRIIKDLKNFSIIGKVVGLFRERV